MQKSIDEEVSHAVKITDYLVSLPSLMKQYIILLLLMVIFGVIISQILSYSIIQGVLSSFLILVVPAVISSLMLRLLRNVMLKRAFFLMLVISVFYMLLYIVYFFTLNLNILILGLSAIFITMFLILYYVLLLRYSALIFSLGQLFFYILMFYYVIFNISIITSFSEEAINGLLIKLFITSLIFSAFIYLLFYIVNAPMKKAFSISGTKVFSLFISQWINDSKDLEKEFERVGIFMETYIDVLFFKNNKGKCLVTIPQVHFGPFGNLGGSDYPNLMSKIFERHVDCSIVMHGACTHDQNPSSSYRIDEVTTPILSLISKESENIKKSKVGFIKSEYAKTISSHLFFEDSLLSSFSRFPETTEDIDFGLGLLLREKGKKYREKCFIADQHNSDTGKITQFLLGSNEASEYIYSMDNLKGKMNNLKLENAKFNFGKIYKPYFTNAGISHNGIGMFCFVMKNYSVLYVVIDSNSINNDIKMAIEDKLKADFDEVLINTTDSHSLNKVSGVINPAKTTDLGLLLQDLSEEAKLIKQNASEFQMFSETIPIKIKVFGPHQSLKLIGVVNSLLSVLKFVVPLIFIFGILFALYILSLL